MQFAAELLGKSHADLDRGRDAAQSCAEADSDAVDKAAAAETGDSVVHPSVQLRLIPGDRLAWTKSAFPTRCSNTTRRHAAVFHLQRGFARYSRGRPDSVRLKCMDSQQPEAGKFVRAALLCCSGLIWKLWHTLHMANFVILVSCPAPSIVPRSPAQHASPLQSFAGICSHPPWQFQVQHSPVCWTPEFLRQG